MKRLLESLGTFLDEAKGKKKRKRRMRRRAREADVALARGIGSAMRARAHEIEKLLPVPWEISGNLDLDRQSVEKHGEVHMDGAILADHDYPIGVNDDGDRFNEAEARIVVSCIPENGGSEVGCAVVVDEFYPTSRDHDSVELKPALRMGEVFVESVWKKKKKPFDPGRDLWPLIKEAMVKLRKKMPEYEELDPDYGLSDTERYL